MAAMGLNAGRAAKIKRLTMERAVITEMRISLRTPVRRLSRRRKTTARDPVIITSDIKI
jgi:hypothetical protein